jgi:hypothetical protein
VIWGLSGPISHLRSRDESDALTVREYGKERGDELDPVLSTYHKYNMGCPGTEFGHLRLHVSFGSAPNGRKPAVESTGFKRVIPDVMCVRTLSTANPFSGL